MPVPIYLIRIKAMFIITHKGIMYHICSCPSDVLEAAFLDVKAQLVLKHNIMKYLLLQNIEQEIRKRMNKE